MQWAVAADGGFMANTLLSKKIREAAQPQYKGRQFVRPVGGFGKGQGDSLDFLKVSNLFTQGGVISENQKMPVTKFAVRKATLTIDEYGNSVEYTGKLEALAQWDPADPVQRAIRNDQARVLDKAAVDAYKLTEVFYTPTSATAGTLDTDGTLTAVAGANFNMFHLKEVVDTAIDALVPPAVGGADGDYVMIATQKLIRGIYDDPDFQDVAKYARGEEVLVGEIGRVYHTRFVRTTSTQALTKVGPSSVLGEGLLLGDDAVVEGVALPEEVRAKIPDDYGRSRGIAWYALLGFKHVWSLAADGEYRVIYITGKAS